MTEIVQNSYGNFQKPKIKLITCLFTNAAHYLCTFIVKIWNAFKLHRLYTE